VLASVFPTFLDAHIAFSVLGLVAAGLLAWRIGERHAGRTGAIVALLTLHVGFAFLLSPPWLYAWDYIDLVVFLALVQLVSEQRSWRWFIGLAAIGALNHEIGLFVALWLIVDPLTRRALRPNDETPLPWRPMVAGGAGVAVGLAVIERLRSALLVEEMGPKIFADAPRDAGGSFHLRLGDNLELIAQLVGSGSLLQLLFVPALTVVCVLGAQLAKKDSRTFAGLVVTYALLLAALLMFGVVVETRIYVVLLPLAVASVVRLLGDPRRDANSGKRRAPSSPRVRPSAET
jgi:hypothetical protein